MELFLLICVNPRVSHVVVLDNPIQSCLESNLEHLSAREEEKRKEAREGGKEKKEKKGGGNFQGKFLIEFKFPLCRYTSHITLYALMYTILLSIRY